MLDEPMVGADRIPQGLRILLVYGIPERELTRELARNGHDVLAVADNAEARRFLGIFKPDVVLVAARDVAQACRDLREQAAGVPIVAITADRDLEARIDALGSGADDCLGSPFHPAELDARMRAASRRRIASARYSGITDVEGPGGGA